MSDKTWKAFERTVATSFGAERNPLSSRHSKHGTESDSLHPRLYIEAKRDRTYFPMVLKHLLQDTMKCAKKEGKIPVIALKEHGKKGFWLLIHSDDLLEIAEERRYA